MNDLQIEYFLAAAEHMSFTKTANEKFVSQPAVSKQISAMESELGVELFVRGHNSAKLTQAGWMFHEYYKKQRQEMELLKQQIRENEKEKVLDLHIGCGSGWTRADFFSKVIKQMEEKQAKFRVCLQSYAFHQIIPALNKNEIDIGITLNTDIELRPKLDIMVLTEVPQVILYSQEHPLAGKQGLTPYDFRKELFFVPQSDRATYIVDLVNGFCEPYGFLPRIQSVRNTESLLMNVHNGLGVAITDFWTHQMGGRQYLYILLESTHTITAVWQRNESNPLVPIFIRELKELFSNLRYEV
ncbi:MAG: LysR family transcriptional regulator [Clostridiales bacterium]|jgi:DNA-binding transcriptional LysR family regulator|nr:LysR family transcriptional regulator [Clostridiales bacterium]